VLLKNENGYLFRMVQQAGHSMAESLLRIAHEVYCRAVLMVPVRHLLVKVKK
jgi:hypothetical protein